MILVLVFALGQVLGSWLEEKMALGYCTRWAIRQLLFSVDPNVVVSVNAIQQSNSRNFADQLK